MSERGVAPRLVLAYDSDAGNGIFGLGWSVGIPAITRKTDKGLRQYCDFADESHRRSGRALVSNRHPKRIQWGNTAMGVAGTAQFEVVFDYGEHDALAPTRHAAAGVTWPRRQDPFSVYRAGFDWRRWLAAGHGSAPRPARAASFRPPFERDRRSLATALIAPLLRCTRVCLPAFGWGSGAPLASA